MLSEIQLIFRELNCTATAPVKITDDIVRQIDENKITFLCLLDYFKAFDSIDQSLSMVKLWYYGVEYFPIDF